MMDRTRRIVYTLLALIPIVGVLFILATIHLLLMLVGLVVTLAGLLVLKQMGVIQPLPEKKSPQTDEPPLPPPPQMQHVYMVLSERDSLDSERILVNRESFTIGRQPDNDWVLNSDRVSRHHLQIDYNPDENACYVTDMGSANGTYLNGERLKKGERHMLIQGDNLMIDDRSFNVQYAYY